MKPTRFFSNITLAAAALALLAPVLATGCGGGSSAPAVDRSTVRTRVEKSLQEGFSTHALSFGTGDFDPSSRFGEPIYDDYLELWTQFTEDGADYFTDEACTDPAGSLRMTFQGDMENLTFEVSSTQIVTKGPRAGTNVTTEMRVDNDSIVVNGSGTTPDTGTFTLSGNWNQSGQGTFTLTSQKAGEEARTYKVVYRADGTAQLTFDNSNWHRYTLDFNADGSGTGTVTGNSDLLPATVVWDSTGTGTVTYKDGSVRNFENFRFDEI